MASTGHVQLGTHQGTNLVSQVGRIMNGQNAGRTTNAPPRDGCNNEPYFFMRTHTQWRQHIQWFMVVWPFFVVHLWWFTSSSPGLSNSFVIQSGYIISVNHTRLPGNVDCRVPPKQPIICRHRDPRCCFKSGPALFFNLASVMAQWPAPEVSQILLTYGHKVAIYGNW